MGLERLALRLRRARRMPPGLLAREIVHRTWRAGVGLSWALRDTVCATYAETGPPGSLRSYVPTLDPPGVAALIPDLAERCELYLEHRFDLLGCGWRTVRHGMACDGFEGHRYETAAPGDAGPGRPVANGAGIASEPVRGVRRVAVDRSRLSAHRLARRLPIRIPLVAAHVVPARAVRPSPGRRHQGAVGAGPHAAPAPVGVGFRVCAQAGSGRAFFRQTHYRDEFRHQVLDFAATNPPRYGVNWRSAMEVAIRVANWLLARDLFLGYGARFDPDFEAVFKRSVREHGRHIAGNLERTPAWSNNHYLANLTGLIFVAAYSSSIP